MLVRVVTVQSEIGRPLSLEEKIYIFKQRPDFVCLPEYALVDPETPDYRRAALLGQDHIEYYQSLSDQLSTCLIGGTVVEPDRDGFYNSCYIFNRGLAVGRYRKRNPMSGELKAGIRKGKSELIVEVDGVRIAILICSDVFQPDNFLRLSTSNVDLIFVPTVSPFRPDDSPAHKRYRDRSYFLAGARLSGAYVIKACGVGTIFGKRLQGRSLVASPWDIIAQVSTEDESSRRLLATTVDISELREFRSQLKVRVSGKPD